MKNLPLHSQLNTALDSWQDWLEAPQQRPLLLYSLPGGLTNRSFVVTHQDRSWVVRLHAANSKQLGIDRRAERSIVSQLSLLGIAPQFCYWSPLFSVYRHIQGRVWQAKDFNCSVQRQRLFNVVKCYQSINIELTDFNYPQHLRHYWDRARVCAPKFWRRQQGPWQDFYRQLKTYHATKRTRCITHHDLQANNIIETKNGIVVLDWEYAGLGFGKIDLNRIEKPTQCSKKLKDTLPRKIAYWCNALWWQVSARNR